MKDIFQYISKCDKEKSTISIQDIKMPIIKPKNFVDTPVSFTSIKPRISSKSTKEPKLS